MLKTLLRSCGQEQFDKYWLNRQADDTHLDSTIRIIILLENTPALPEIYNRRTNRRGVLVLIAHLAAQQQLNHADRFVSTPAEPIGTALLCVSRTTLP